MALSSQSPLCSANASASISTHNRRNFFSKRAKFGSKRESRASDKFYEPLSSDKIIAELSPFLLDKATETAQANLPSPASSAGASYDPKFLHLRENIRCLRKGAVGPDRIKVDVVWEIYKNIREESLQLCKSLVQRSQTILPKPFESLNIRPLDIRYSFRTSVGETAVKPPFQVNQQWFHAIREYKWVQEAILENLRTSLLPTYKGYESDAPERQLQVYLADKAFRKNLITKWRDTSVPRMKGQDLQFWEQYNIRLMNYDRLKLDLQEIETLLELADSQEQVNMAIREYVIAKNGDAILEFRNSRSKMHPILRFRVSSHLLAQASPLFDQILTPPPKIMIPIQTVKAAPLDMIKDLPPPPTNFTCSDGTEVKIYRMPQLELNENEALTILLHAAHMHNQKVPREVEFSVLVSIAEVCLRYRCTSPIELQVEYQWLPQWIHMAGDEYRDGLLVVAYAFGERALFTKMSKAVILNAVDEEEIESQKHWPQAVQAKIKAVRAAKIAQIQSCCTNAVAEYFQPPAESTDRRSSVGSLGLTSIPRCPRGSSLCDATNLGSIMLAFNESRILPSIMNNTGFPDICPSPKRSLKELVDRLKLMPSAPQVHPGVCDHVPCFRHAIDDVYNSILGLTLRDVSGQNGWALSKHAEDPYDVCAEVHELPGTELAQSSSSLSINDTVCLEILSHLDNIEDVMSTAMVCKGFYGAYKRKEAVLLKNLMKAQMRTRTMSKQNPNFTEFSDSLRRIDLASTSPLTLPSPYSHSESGDSEYLSSEENISSWKDDFYNTSPSPSPNPDDLPLSQEEAQKILWPGDLHPTTPNVQPAERNVKYLAHIVAHIEEKTRNDENKKHLRDEKDQALGIGIHRSGSNTPP